MFRVNSPLDKNSKKIYISHHQERRNVFCDRNQLDLGISAWILEQVPNEQEYYRIRSASNGEYLYAAANDLALDSQRRRVFTWIEQNSNVNTWELSGDWLIYYDEVKGHLIENR